MGDRVKHSVQVFNMTVVYCSSRSKVFPKLSDFSIYLCIFRFLCVLLYVRMLYVIVGKQARVEDVGDVCVEQSASSEHSVSALRAAEVEPPLQQQQEPSSPHLSHCDDEALASAENENNMNVESENNTSNADRSVEAGATTDVLTADENLETVAGLHLGDEPREVTLLTMPDDSTSVPERFDDLQLSAEVNTDVRITKPTGDHDVLSSSYSDMVIEVQGHEFSDEELQEAEKKEDSREPAVQPLLAKSLVQQQQQQHSLQRSANSKSVTSEQRQKNQPATRVIRLNRDFHQHQRSPSTAECKAESRASTQSGHRLIHEPGSQCRSSDALSRKPTLTTVRHSSDARSSRPKQLRLSSSSRLSQSSRKLPARKNLTVKVQYTVSPDSPAVTSSKSAAGDGKKKMETPRPVVQDVVREPVPDPADGSSESPDSLSKTQLEILELEMRARAIKAMIRAQEEMEQVETGAKKRRSSAATDSSQPTRKMPAPEHTSPTRSGRSVRPQSSMAQPRGELRSLQSVIGRSIIRRAEFVARHQRRVAATDDRLTARRQFVEQRRVPQASLTASRRTVRLQPETRLRPMRYVVATESSPRVVRFPSARVGVALPFSARRQRQRRFQLREHFTSPNSSRGDKRRVLVSSSNHRSVTRLSN